MNSLLQSYFLVFFFLPTGIIIRTNLSQCRKENDGEISCEDFNKITNESFPLLYITIPQWREIKSPKTSQYFVA